MVSLWALVIGYVAWLWFHSLLLGLVIGIAVVVNIVTAAVFGVLLPVLLDKLRIDPALSGSVILTTVTDIIGFVAFGPRHPVAGVSGQVKAADLNAACCSSGGRIRPVVEVLPLLLIKTNAQAV